MPTKWGSSGGRPYSLIWAITAKWNPASLRSRHHSRVRGRKPITRQKAAMIPARIRNWRLERPAGRREFFLVPRTMISRPAEAAMTMAALVAAGIPDKIISAPADPVSTGLSANPDRASSRGWGFLSTSRYKAAPGQTISSR